MHPKSAPIICQACSRWLPLFLLVLALAEVDEPRAHEVGARVVGMVGRAVEGLHLHENI